MGLAFALQAGHLGPTDTAFFAHWHRLLDLEEGSSSSRRADMWRLPGDAKPRTNAETGMALMAKMSRPQWMTSPRAAFCVLADRCDGRASRGAAAGAWWVFG